MIHLKKLGDNSIDSVVTDPPAGISFMGKSWDSDKGGRDEWIKWMTGVMSECLRVLKPGGHALVWAIPRTSHWTATAVENAGFEVRDVVTHLFGSGFPKSHNLEKATDGIAKGQGTALKPAAEFWILARKPLSEKTVAKNVLKWGTGGLNIDGSRIEASKDYGRSAANSKGTVNSHNGFDGKAFKMAERDADYASPLGRFPANLVLSGDAPEMLDEQSGLIRARNGYGVKGQTGGGTGAAYTMTKSSPEVSQKVTRESENGVLAGASRFFYCAKVSPSERNAGLEDLTKKVRRSDARPNSGDLSGKFPDHDNRERAGNHHPTVKPIKLMQYLIKLITPPGGTVLDPFMGSGSTGVAAKRAGFKFIGIEKEQEYFEIAEKRIDL